jgi:hypothetical protein
MQRKSKKRHARRSVRKQKKAKKKPEKKKSGRNWQEIRNAKEHAAKNEEKAKKIRHEKKENLLQKTNVADFSLIIFKSSYNKNGPSLLFRLFEPIFF